jgi:CBS domain-containing protein
MTREGRSHHRAGQPAEGASAASRPHREDFAPGSSPRTVGDVMTRTVIAVGRQATFKDITQNMREWHVSAVPVLEADGRVIGVVSEADLLAKEEYRDGVPALGEPRERMEQLRKSGALSAGELMTTPAVSVHEDAPLTEAARIMAHKRVKRLPVVDGEGRLAGIVSRVDLLKVFLRTDEDIAEEITRDVIDMLPGAAASPASPASLSSSLRVRVEKGVVTVMGEPADPSLVPVVARLIRSVEGVVDVRFDLD